MNQEIKAYLIAQCEQQGMEKVDVSHIAFNELLFANEFASVSVTEGHLDEMYFFEMWNEELSRELMYRLPIPETLPEFQKMCEALNVFTYGN